MSINQHKNRANVLAPHSATSSAHPRLTQRRLVASCEDANGRLTPAWLAVVKHLKADPKPRTAWTNRRRENALALPSISLILYTQNAMIAAIMTGDRDRVEATALEIEAFGEELKNAMLAPYRAWAGGTPSLNESGIEAVRAVSEVGPAIAIALVSKSTGDVERAVSKSVAAVRSVQPFCAAARESNARRLEVAR